MLDEAAFRRTVNTLSAKISELENAERELYHKILSNEAVRRLNLDCITQMAQFRLSVLRDFMNQAERNRDLAQVHHMLSTGITQIFERAVNDFYTFLENGITLKFGETGVIFEGMPTVEVPAELPPTPSPIPYDGKERRFKLSEKEYLTRREGYIKELARHHFNALREIQSTGLSQTNHTIDRLYELINHHKKIDKFSKTQTIGLAKRLFNFLVEQDKLERELERVKIPKPDASKPGVPNLYIWTACANGDIAFIQRLWDDIALKFLNGKTFLSQLNSDGDTLLGVAAAHGKYEAVKLLLDLGAQPDQSNTYKNQPIHKAARQGSVQIVAELHRRGVSLDVAGTEQRTPLHYAAFNGHTEVVLYLLKWGANPNLQTSKEDGYKTPLHDAVRAGREEVVACLLPHRNVSLVIPDRMKWTPLHNAIKDGNVAIANMFLQEPRWKFSFDPASAAYITSFILLEPRNNLEDILALLIQPELWGFLIDSAKNEGIFRTALLSMIEKGKEKQKTFNVKNALSLLSLAGVRLPSNLQGVYAPGVNFQRANLYEIDFRGAVLDGGNFTGAILSRAQLAGTHLSSIHFAHATYYCDSPVQVIFPYLDNQLLIGGCKDGSVRIWKKDSVRQVRKIDLHTDEITGMELHENKLVTLSKDAQVSIYDLNNEKLVQRFNYHKAPIVSHAFHAQKKLLVTGSADGNICMWDLNTGFFLKQFKAHDGEVTNLVITAHQIISGGTDKHINLWDLQTGKKFKSYDQGYLGEGMKALMPIPNTSKVAWACSQGSALGYIQIFDLSTESQEFFRIEEKRVANMRFMDQGRKLLLAYEDGTICIMDFEQQKPLQTFTVQEGQIKHVSYIPSTGQIVTANSNKTFCVLDIEKNREFPKDYNSSLFNMEYLPAKNQLLVKNADHLGEILNCETGALVDETKALQQTFQKYFSTEAGHLISIKKENDSWEVIDVTANSLQLSKITAPQFHPHISCYIGGVLLAVSSGNDMIRLINIATGHVERTFGVQTTEVTHLTPISPQHIAFATFENEIHSLQFSSEQIETTHGIHQAKINALIHLPKEDTLVSACEDGSIGLHSLVPKIDTKFLREHRQAVLCLTPFKDHYFVSGSTDGSMGIWDVRSGQHLMIKHPAPLAVIRTQDNLIFAGDIHGGVWCWEINLQNTEYSLKWATRPDLICSGVNIEEAIGLSEQNKAIMRSHGAR